MKFKRIILIIMDGCGIGALPDAVIYGDEDANTLKNLSFAIKRKLNIPFLVNLGLANLVKLKDIKKLDTTNSSYGKAHEISKGKDTTTGHWEMMGIELKKAFPLFPKGFPDEFIRKFEERIGTKIIGNKKASGTEILKELGEEHLKTGYPIVYTSADSVFQIAAHEEKFGLERLYKICEIAREMLTGDLEVSRVIARPFIGTNKDNFERTINRHDYSIKPLGKTILNSLAENNYSVIAIGKISDIFCGSGITESIKVKDNKDLMIKLIEYVKNNNTTGLIFANANDFDTKYGHRRNVSGFAQALEEFDKYLGNLLANLKQDDLLIITADHGNDPTYMGTDHTREAIPILITGAKVKINNYFGVRETFADIGKTILENFEIEDKDIKIGQSFLSLIYDDTEELLKKLPKIIETYRDIP